MKTILTCSIVLVWLCMIAVIGVIGSGAVLFDIMRRRACLLLFCLFLTACATDTPDAAVNRRHRISNQLWLEAGKIVGSIAVSTLGNVVQSQLSGTTPDWGHAAADAAWKSAGTVFDGNAIKRVINAATEGEIPQVANQSAMLFDAAIANGVRPQQAAYAVGDIISAKSLVAK